MARCTDASITAKVDCVGSFNTMNDLCGYQPTDAMEYACRMSKNGTTFPREWMVFPSLATGGW